MKGVYCERSTTQLSLVRPKIAAQMLSISTRTLWRLISTGKSNPVRLSPRIVRLKVADIHEFHRSPRTGEAVSNVLDLQSAITNQSADAAGKIAKYVECIYEPTDIVEIRHFSSRPRRAILLGSRK